MNNIFKLYNLSVLFANGYREIIETHRIAFYSTSVRQKLKESFCSNYQRNLVSLNSKLSVNCNAKSAVRQPLSRIAGSDSRNDLTM